MTDTNRHLTLMDLNHAGCVALYGAGGRGKYVLEQLQGLPGLEVHCFIDSIRSGTFQNLPLLSFEEFRRDPGQVDLVLITSSAWRDIVLNLAEAGIENWAVFEMSESDYSHFQRPSLRDRLVRLIFRTLLMRRHKRLWEQADVNRPDLGTFPLHCPYCGSTHGTFIHAWTIDSVEHIGLFDNDTERLARLHWRGLAHRLPRNLFAELLRVSLASLTGRSTVHCCHCPDCGLYYQNFPHTPESKDYYYSELYRLILETPDSDGDRLFGRGNQQYFVKIKEIGVKYLLDSTGLSPGSQVLEVGCAEGLALRYLACLGYEPCGVEPSVQMAAYARKKLGLANVTCATYAPDLFGENAFDCAFTQHVAEHVVDLRRFFSAFAKHVRPAGYLLIQVPSADDLVPDHYDMALEGGHIYSMSERFLRRALDDHGFTTEKVIRTSEDYLKANPHKHLPELGVFTCGDRLNGISILAKKR
jgi:SAM-dependent methyltransferase